MLLVGDPCLAEVTNVFGKPVWTEAATIRQRGSTDDWKTCENHSFHRRDATKGEVFQRLKSVALAHIATHGRAETGEVLVTPNPGWTSPIPRKEHYILTMSDEQPFICEKDSLCLAAVKVAVEKSKLRAWLVSHWLSCVLVPALFWCHSGRLMTRPPWSS